MAESDSTEANPEDSGLEDLGTIDVGFVVDESPENRLNLNDLALSFENNYPDLVTGKRVFGKTITGLHEALMAYARILDGREHALQEFVDITDLDPDLLGASDHVHEALFSLRAAHHAYTGHPFLGDPLMRERNPSEGPRNGLDGAAGSEEPTENPAEGPVAQELGFSMPLNKLLQSGSGRMVQLTTARVYSDGVMLSVECALIRGGQESAEAWERRCNPPSGFLELGVVATDRITGKSYRGSMQQASRRDFKRVQRLDSEL